MPGKIKKEIENKNSETEKAAVGREIILLVIIIPLIIKDMPASAAAEKEQDECLARIVDPAEAGERERARERIKLNLRRSVC